jgi:hypothetical protein
MPSRRPWRSGCLRCSAINRDDDQRSGSSDSRRDGFSAVRSPGNHQITAQGGPASEGTGASSETRSRPHARAGPPRRGGRSPSQDLLSTPNAEKAGGTSAFTFSGNSGGSPRVPSPWSYGSDRRGDSPTGGGFGGKRAPLHDSALTVRIAQRIHWSGRKSVRRMGAAPVTLLADETLNNGLARRACRWLLSEGDK